MTKKQFEEYKERLSKLGSRPGLDSIRELLKLLGNPQDQMEYIHVAGTNGKGSVCAYISSILQCAGMKVGRYTSPAVFDYRERFVADGRMIGEKTMLRLMDRVEEACGIMEKEGKGHPTLFEAETAMAFLFFAQKKCRVVVLECGMGGLMDATNIVSATLMEVIAPISHDHEEYLGKELSDIAKEKAGIIKEGSICVTAVQSPDAAEVIRKVCEQKHASLIVADECEMSGVKKSLTGQSFRYKGKRYITRLSGYHQTDNAHLALRAVKALYPDIGDDIMAKGLENARWPGRFELISRKPDFVIDGAHNRAGAEDLAKSVELYFANRKIIYIMGVFGDKDVTGIINETVSAADQVICVTLPDKSRSLDAVTLASKVMEVNGNVTAADSIEEAVQMAYLFAGRDDCIVAFGSLSFLKKITDTVPEYRKRGRYGR